MLTNIKSPHWLAGGTGITNFGLEQLSQYEETIRRSGDSGYVVSQHPLTDSRFNAGQSLHYIGAPYRQDHSDFWRLFSQVKGERDPIKLTLTRAQAEVLMTICYTGVVGCPIASGRARTNEICDLLQEAGIQRARHHETDGGKIQFVGHA